MSLFDRLREETDKTTEEPAATDGGGDPLGGELEGMDDEFGGDGVGDDSEPFDENDAYANEELERRIDEVETELASLSSTVNTIRSENEEISDTVDTVEENVRKLLDVYEMVTRGINPFTDDVDAASGTAGGGPLGLFDTNNGDEQDERDDPNADDRSIDDETDDAGSESGPSFDDLKAKYEAGESDWDEDSERSNEPIENTAEPDEVTPIAASNGSDEVDFELQFEKHTLSDSPDAEKPYLRGLPDGYVADLLVLEWLEYLVDTAGYTEAERAIDYYEAIEWIDDAGAEQLKAFMEGFDTIDDEETPRLSISHHTQSLRYICQLSSNSSAPVVLDGWRTTNGRD